MRKTREVVIHSNGLPATLHVEGKSIDAFWNIFIRHEQALDQLIVLLEQADNCTHEPIVVDVAFGNLFYL